MPAPNVIQIGETGEAVVIDIDPAVEIIGAEVPLPAVGARRLDDLEDVQGADAALPGQALVRGSGGIWHGANVSGGGSESEFFLQATPAATWAIPHGLGRYPQVTVIDLAGERLMPDVEYGSVDDVTITHAEPTAGAAILT